MDYKKQYLHPNWQKKRLEILDRDKFTCQMCGDNDKTLHVHHLCYHGEKEVWDYDNCYLTTLCVSCHKEETINKKSTTAAVNSLMHRVPLVATDLLLLQAVLHRLSDIKRNNQSKMTLAQWHKIVNDDYECGAIDG